MAIELGERFWSKVNKNAESGCWEWTAHRSTAGYGRFGLQGESRDTHRLVWQSAKGEIPEGLVIDHMCHNRACVNTDHLRLVTHAENMQNIKGVRADSTSGFRGVDWQASRKRWRARGVLNGKTHHLGRYKTPEEAAAVASAWRRDNHPCSISDQAAPPR